MIFLPPYLYASKSGMASCAHLFNIENGLGLWPKCPQSRSSHILPGTRIPQYICARRLHRA